MKKMIRGTRGMLDAKMRGMADGGNVSMSSSLTNREIESAGNSTIAGPATKNYVRTEGEFRKMKAGGAPLDPANSYSNRVAHGPMVKPATGYASRFESVKDDDTLRNAPQGETGRGLMQEAKARQGLRKRDIDKATGYANGGMVKRKMANGGMVPDVQTAVPPPRPGFANGGKIRGGGTGDDRGGPAAQRPGNFSAPVNSGRKTMVRTPNSTSSPTDERVLTSRGFGASRVQTAAGKFDPGSVARWAQNQRDGDMAEKLDMPLDNYRRAAYPGKANGGKVEGGKKDMMADKKMAKRTPMAKFERSKAGRTHDKPGYANGGLASKSGGSTMAHKPVMSAERLQAAKIGRTDGVVGRALGKKLVNFNKPTPAAMGMANGGKVKKGC